MEKWSETNGMIEHKLYTILLQEYVFMLIGN